MTTRTGTRRLPSFLLNYRQDGRIGITWLAITWFTVHAILFYHFGIRTDLEASKYISQANLLLTDGRPESANFWFYSTQIFLLAAVIKLKLGFVAAYVVQLLVNGFAMWRFYKLCQAYASQATATIVTLLLLTCFPFQAFTCFLQTESLFFSLCIIISSYLLTFKRLNPARILFTLLGLCLLIVTRPTGVLFAMAALLYLFFAFSRLNVAAKIFLCIVSLIAGGLLINVALGSGGEFDFMLPFREENIICGVNTTVTPVHVNTTGNGNSLAGLFYYITHNFSQFLRLTWLKTLAFFGLIRSYYSTMYNAYLAVLIFPLYLLALISIRYWKTHQRSLVGYCVTLILLTWLTVILTCDDWHNRFFFTILPFLCFLCLPAFEHLLSWMGIKMRRKR